MPYAFTYTICKALFFLAILSSKFFFYTCIAVVVVFYVTKFALNLNES